MMMFPMHVFFGLIVIGANFCLCKNAVFTWTSVHDMQVYSAAFKTTSEYAALHGYDRIINTSQYYFATDVDNLCNSFGDNSERCRERAPLWYKVHVLRDLCRRSEYDYILALDADAAINRPELSLNEFVNRAPSATVFAISHGKADGGDL